MQLVPNATRPREVFIRREPDTIIHCELAYKGMDEKWIGTWEVCTPLRDGDRLFVRGLGRNYVVAPLDSQQHPMKEPHEEKQGPTQPDPG